MKKSRRWRYLIRGSPFLTQQPASRPSFLPFSTNLFCHKVGLAPLSRREVEGEKWNLFIFQSLLQIDAPLDYCQKLIDRSRYLVSRFWPHFHHPSSFYLCRQHLSDGRRKFQLHSQRWGFIVVFTPLRPPLAGLTRGLVSTQCLTWPGIRIIIILSSPILKWLPQYCFKMGWYHATFNGLMS